MLISFTVGNYRSFKDKKTLNMEATAIKDLKESVIVRDDYRLLSAAVIYGANSSGKSNFIGAIQKFRKIVLQSSKLNSSDKLEITPFLLNEETAREPSYFEVELLLLSGVTYTYGFVANDDKVSEEWLYRKEKKSQKEVCLFVRTEEGIGVTKDYTEGKGLEGKARSNGLFLAVVDSFNGSMAQEVMKEIKELIVFSGINHEHFSEFTTKWCNQVKKMEDNVMVFLSQLNLGFTKFEVPDDAELAKKVKAFTQHTLYDHAGIPGGEVRFTMKEHESSGTNKLFDLAIVFVLGLMGMTIIVDELDSKLHPLITRQIVNMFNDPAVNTGGGQLIFSTHDTNLLNIKTLRRDQIWFTEKDTMEATDLYSLVEFREPDGTKIRNDRSFEKDYINGRYGAIPYIKS